MAAVTPSPVADAIMNGGGTRTGMTPSQVNSIRISTVMYALSLNARSHAGTTDGKEFINLALSLARGIDFAIASQEVPSLAKDLPSHLKQICQRNSKDTQLQASLMVLMISVKNACQNGWFTEKDSEDLMNVINEFASVFGSIPNPNTELSSSHPVISSIMSRFYPRLKLGHVLVFLEAKPGFEAYVNDFLITKNLKSGPGEKIRLFVVQTDSIETAACLVSPPKVNFILNGKGVERRTNITMDTGPQTPTVVKQFLKYGSNLLQAVGNFNGNYIIAVALMSDLQGPDSSVLQDYIHRAPATLDSDPDIVEGPSRISLNCPISFRRIKTPVKGHSCNHIQCFDFDNYVDINSRRPSWRCPHCNQPVCFTDIRIDQKVVKILKEVGPKVSEIVISSDWSWKTATENDNSTPKPGQTASSIEENCRNVSLPSSPLVHDLTETDDYMDDIITHEAEDTKINPNESAVPSMVAANSNVSNDFWSGMYFSTFGTRSLNAQSGPNYAASAIPSDPNVSSAPMETTPVLSEMHSPDALQLQQYQFGGNPVFTSEYGTLPQLQPSNVTRTPIAVQALPALQMSYPAPPQQRSRFHSHPQFSQMSMQLNQHLPGLQPQQNPSVLTPNHAGHVYRTSNEFHNSNQQQQMTNIRMSQAQVQSPCSMQQPSPNFRRSPSHVGALPDNRGSYPTNQQGHLLAAANAAVNMSIDSPRTVPPHPVTNNPVNNVLRRSSSPREVQRGNVGVSPHPVTNNPVNNVLRRSSSPREVQRGNVGVSPQPVMRSDCNGQFDPNWRPTVRMRGALTGQAYSDAMNQYIIQPTQQAQAQAARPPNQTLAGLPSRPPGM